MSHKNLMQIKEFARLTGIKPENLRFYDQMGLLSPEVRGENGYRYYSRHQLNSAYLISDLRELGVGLEEIRQYSLERTPEKMLALFDRQEQRLLEEIDRLHGIRECMRLHGDMARQALGHGENAQFLRQQEKEPLFFCPILPPESDEDEEVIHAYGHAAQMGVNLGYPFGAMVAREHFESGQWNPVHRYYFKTQLHANGWKPEGLYAVVYGRCDLRHLDGIYSQLLDFVREEKLTPCGDVYEECLLDEMAVQDASRYGVRLEIPVKKN